MASKPLVMEDVPGSQFRPNTKIVDSKTVLANSGTDVVMIDPTDMTRSNREPSRIPANTPSISDNGIIMAKVQNPRIAVFQRRGHRTSETGTLNRTESPKSPDKKFPNQDP